MMKVFLSSVLIALISGSLAVAAPGGKKGGGGGNQSAPLSPVLLDANQSPIGTVVSIDQDFNVIVLVEVENALGEKRFTALRITKDLADPFFASPMVRSSIVWDAPGCTGQAYLVDYPTSLLANGIYPSGVIEWSADGDWYVATSFDLVSFFGQSSMGYLGECNSYAPSSSKGLPAEEVEAALSDRFPAPYTLELR